jgi:AraC-like DNA-binding protein
MSKIVELLRSFPLPDGGFSESHLEGVHFFKSTQPIPRTPLVYDPGICIVAQGRKIGYLGNHVFQYDPNNYLVASVTMPFECEASASPEEPLLGLYIDVDMPILHDLISQLDIQFEIDNASKKGLPRGIGPAVMDEDMLDATNKLIKCLHSKIESQILGPGLVREILYRALCGAQAPVLYSLARHGGTFSQVARTMKLMQTEYAENLDVKHLANTACMSISSFHRAFKKITSDSPLQYLKKIRLTKAKNLMLLDNKKAYIAADKVGYSSFSQFSREFKRYFGQSPAELMRELRTA